MAKVIPQPDIANKKEQKFPGEVMEDLPKLVQNLVEDSDVVQHGP